MRNTRIYGVLVALVIWIFGGTYWIISKFCPNHHHVRNNPLSLTYNPVSHSDTIAVAYSQLDYLKEQGN